MQCYLVELLFSLIRAGDASVRHMDQTETAKRLAEDSLVDTIERYIVQNVAEQPSLQILCQHFSVSLGLSLAVCAKTFRITAQYPANP